MQGAHTCREHTHAGSTHMQRSSDATHFEIPQGKAEHASSYASSSYVSVLEGSQRPDAVTDVLWRNVGQIVYCMAAQTAQDV